MTAALQAHDAVEKAGQLNKQKDEGTLGNAKRYLAKLAGEKQPSPAKAVTPEERMSQLLNEVHEHLKARIRQYRIDTAAQRKGGTSLFC